ncbi:hypothetical protein CLIB1423_02S07822 [[Candida] railenensis]|uniref:Yippee domain-containing protein n=1 Tax=[Candida] railenensis TaxID=45579 RepID=A0A9P0QLU6_9ASCO|nr:hypothetical protein CLIB1423_02S07822 [[Candida] railenensis]
MKYACESCNTQISDFDVTEVFVCNGEATYLVDNVANIKLNDSYGCVQNNIFGCVNVGGIDCSTCGCQVGMQLLNKDIRDQFIFDDDLCGSDMFRSFSKHDQSTISSSNLDEFVYALELLEVENTNKSHKITLDNEQNKSTQNSLEEYASALEVLETENMYRLQVSTLRNRLLRNTMDQLKLNSMIPVVNDHGNFVFQGIFLLLSHSISVAKE